MFARRKYTATCALLFLAVAASRAQEAAPAQVLAAVPPAADDGRIQQYVQLLQPTMSRELDFVRQVCDLTPEQRPKVKAAADAAVKEAAKTMLKPQRQPMTIFAAKAVRDGINQALKQTLTAEQFDRFTAEDTSRQAATKKAAIQAVVSQIDGALFLSQEQREKISAALDASWQPEWEYWLIMRQHQFGDQYLPQIPDQQVVPHLTAEQHVVWKGLQKIMFNTWQNNGRRQADDAWWTGKTDTAPKAKAAKGKSAAAKAAAPVP